MSEKYIILFKGKTLRTLHSLPSGMHVILIDLLIRKKNWFSVFKNLEHVVPL